MAQQERVSGGKADAKQESVCCFGVPEVSGVGARHWLTTHVLHINTHISSPLVLLPPSNSQHKIATQTQKQTQMINKPRALQTSQPIQTKAKAQAKQANLLSPPLAPPISDDHTHEQQIMGRSCASPSCPLCFIFCTQNKKEGETRATTPREGTAFSSQGRFTTPPAHHSSPALSAHTHTHQCDATQTPKKATTTQAT